MVKKVTRKSMLIRPSGRSTDFISPSFGHGCLYNCSYCYMKRHKPEGLNIATNTENILTDFLSGHSDELKFFFEVSDPPISADLLHDDKIRELISTALTTIANPIIMGLIRF